MAETWTNITTQDDPDSGNEAIAKWRAYRDNDDALSRIDHVVQSKTSALTGINQTPTNRVATGVKVRFFKPSYATKISFDYCLFKVSGTATRFWAVVRFNNNPALETALVDTGAGGSFPATVTDFDISSLVEGVYEAEIYAGANGAAGDAFYAALPSGVSATDSPGVVDNTSLRVFRMGSVSWSSSPASDLTDALLTADNGVTQGVATMLYDRDEKLRHRPASFYFPEKTGGPTIYEAPNWIIAKHVLGKIYVPRSADVLNLQVEMKNSLGGAGVTLCYPSCEEMEAAGYGWFNNETMIGYTTSSTTYEFRYLRINLSMLRGREVTLSIRIGVTGAASTGYVRCQESLQGHYWSDQPAIVGNANTQDPNNPGFVKKAAYDWRAWGSAGRSTGALMSAGWWRRVTNRDVDLLERQMLQRGFSYLSPSSTSSYTVIADSQMRIYQPKGLGAKGGKLVAICEIAGGASSARSWIKLDYSDQPDAENFVGKVDNVPNGIHQMSRPARADRDGTVQTFAVFALRPSASPAPTYRVLEAERALMRWSL